MASDTPNTGEKEEKKIGVFRAPQENFTRNQFHFGKLLGLGSYSKVVKVKKKDTGQEYALKVMDKRHIMRENKVQYVKMERLILDQLDHPGVTRLHFTFQDNLYLYMGMECCHGGELFDQIQRKGQLPLEEARFYAAEVVDALEYIHSEGLIHRDLKPENILFTADGHVKIADFGSSKMLRAFTNGIITCDPDEKSCTFVGTAEYVAPEVLNSQPVTPRVDMWALGCIVFQMLDGRPPFKGASEYLTFQKVLSRDLVMPQHIPPDAKDLIEKLLNLVPEKRPDFVTIKKHPFFTGVKWADLWMSQAPKLALLSGQPGDDWDVAQLGASLDAFDLSESSSDSGSASNSQASSPKGIKSGEFSACVSRTRRSSSPSGRPAGCCTVKHTLTEDCFSEQWQRFLGPGEKLLGTSMVRKYSGMGTRRQQLLLTDKPRLAIVDLKKMIIKHEISWSNYSTELYVEVEDQLRFSIRTPNLIWHFEDLRGLANGWRGAIEKLQNELLRKEQVYKEKLFEVEYVKPQQHLDVSEEALVHSDLSACAQASAQALPISQEKSPADIQASCVLTKEPAEINSHPSQGKESELVPRERKTDEIRADESYGFDSQTSGQSQLHVKKEPEYHKEESQEVLDNWGDSAYTLSEQPGQVPVTVQVQPHLEEMEPAIKLQPDVVHIEHAGNLHASLPMISQEPSDELAKIQDDLQPLHHEPPQVFKGDLPYRDSHDKSSLLGESQCSVAIP